MVRPEVPMLWMLLWTLACTKYDDPVEACLAAYQTSCDCGSDRDFSEDVCSDPEHRQDYCSEYCAQAPEECFCWAENMKSSCEQGFLDVSEGVCADL